LQQVLLPKYPPRLNGFSFAAMNIPSRLIGGDLYDFIQFTDQRIGLAIGDVSGKGTPGAILMATLYASYRGLVHEQVSLDKMMFDLNHILKKRSTPGNFATMFYGELHADSKILTYCNAGHNAPILLHADHKIERLDEGGTVLGFVENAPYSMSQVELLPGDIVFLFTDGLTESFGPDEEMFGEDRLVDVLLEHRDLQPSTLLRRIYLAVKRFLVNGNPQDDFTTLVMKVGEYE
jgi:sigma-B regulation protein RsbU (phosphoserine phosphatase)